PPVDSPAAASSLETCPVFDVELALRRAGGRETLAAEMHAMLRNSLTKEGPQIRALAARHQHDALLEAVHKLHGATRYCGAPRLEQAARQLEEKLKTHASAADIQAAAQTLLEEIERLLTQAPDSITANAST